MCFVFGVIIGTAATLIQFALFVYTLHLIVGVDGFTGKEFCTSYIRLINGIISLIACESDMFSLSVVLSVFSFCSFD